MDGQLPDDSAAALRIVGEAKEGVQVVTCTYTLTLGRVSPCTTSSRLSLELHTVCYDHSVRLGDKDSWQSDV